MKGGWRSEIDIAQATGVPLVEVRRHRREELDGRQAKRIGKRMSWSPGALESFLRDRGIEGALCYPEAIKVPQIESEEPETGIFTVIRSWPKVRNPKVVLAVPGVVQWKTAVVDGAATIKVRNNQRVKPGFRMRAERISGNYWAFRKYV